MIRVSNPRFLVLLLGFCFLFIRCEEEATKQGPKNSRKSVQVQRFEGDSAYLFVQRQVDFGPRTPNSEGHQNCKNWLVQKLESFGAEVIVQDFQAVAATSGEEFTGSNIIAQYNIPEQERILLMAHWDTRTVADKDPEESNRNLPIDGADDGGSGVGVLLEIARHLQKNPIELGVDIVLFDAEDNGVAQSSNDEEVRTWCLGSQHWSKNPHRQNYRANNGILLDMVGAKDAQFTQERASMEFAPQFMSKVWNLANRMGKGKYFLNIRTSEVLDDHSFVNALAGIPSINIINHPPDKMFGDYHHTLQDNMDIIDKTTLAAVGQVVLAVVYQMNNGNF